MVGQPVVVSERRRGQGIGATDMGRGKLLWIVLAVVLVAGAYAAFTWRSARAVLVQKAEVGAVVQYVDEHARTRLPKIWRITMPVPGRLLPIKLEVGDRVSNGQTVAEIEPADLTDQLTAAEAQLARVEAALRESQDLNVELNALAQAKQYHAAVEHWVEAASEQVRANQASLRFAERNIARQRALAERSAASPEALDRAELEHTRAEAQLANSRFTLQALEALRTATALLPPMIESHIARKKLQSRVLEAERHSLTPAKRMAERNLRRATITSPVDGVVLARHVENLRWLPAGAVLLELGQLDQLEVEADVLTEQAAALKPGDPVDIYGPAIGLRPAKGRVHRVDPAGFTKISSLGVEQQRVWVIIRFEPGELQRLRAKRAIGVGYRVRVRIRTAEEPKAVRIPTSALFRSVDGGWQCFCLRDGRAKLTDVKLGLINDDWAQVLDGLKPDDPVIVAPDPDLADGQRVKALSR